MNPGVSAASVSMKKVFIVVATLVAVIAVGLGIFFSNYYVPGTIISTEFSDYHVEYMSKDGAVRYIVDDTLKYEYNISGKNLDNKIILSDIAALSYEDVNNLLPDTKIGAFNQVHSVNIKDLVSFNSSEIENRFISMTKDIEIIESRDAELVRNGNKYEIIPEIVGNELSDKTLDILVQNLMDFEKEINFEVLDTYIKPNVLSTDEALNHNLEQYRRYNDFIVEYTFGNKKEVLDASMIYDWLIPNYKEGTNMIDAESPFTVDDEKLSQYVSSLNKKYTTLGMARNFTTSTGEEIVLSNGDYGWWLDTGEMKNDILANVLSITSINKDAFYKQKADVYGDNLDIGNSYIEISLDNQHVWMYVDGELIIDSDVVTGNVKNGWNTRKGIFSLTYKTKNATLRGPGYASFVYYWMPFDGGIGMHDATWRYSFGGNIYKTNGSHGCVNMPLETAKTIYNNITSTMPIIVW